MTLKGQVHGNNRTDLTKKAIEEAIRYYDTECVTIWLSRETANTNYIDTGRLSGTEFTAGPTTYSADYEADIKHRWGVTTDSQGKCLDCRIDIPNDKEPRP